MGTLNQGRPGQNRSYCYSPTPKVNALEVQEIQSEVAVATHFWGPYVETLVFAPVVETPIFGVVGETLAFLEAATSHESQNK